jgi:hypothetical protein
MLHTTAAEDLAESSPDATDRSMRVVEVAMAIVAVVVAGILTFVR